MNIEQLDNIHFSDYFHRFSSIGFTMITNSFFIFIFCIVLVLTKGKQKILICPGLELLSLMIKYIWLSLQKVKHLCIPICEFCLSSDMFPSSQNSMSHFKMPVLFQTVGRLSVFLYFLRKTFITVAFEPFLKVVKPLGGTDREAWRAVIHRVAKSRTRLSD